MSSFLQFYEHMKWSKEFYKTMQINEAEFKKGVKIPGTIQLRDPTVTGRATDGNVGRKTQVMDDPGQAMSAKFNKEKWDQAVQQNPNLAYYTKARDAMRQDRQADDDVNKPDDIGIQTGAGEDDIEDLASTNRGTSNLIGLIKDLTKQMMELQPHVQSFFDPKMLQIVKKLHNATSLFMKDKKVIGPEADRIAKLHQSMAEILYKSQMQDDF